MVLCSYPLWLRWVRGRGGVGHTRTPKQGCGMAARRDSLLCAVREGDVGKVRTALRDDPQLVQDQGLLLHTALSYGNDNVVLELLMHRAQVHDVDATGSTPLHVAAKVGCSLRVLHALAAKGDVNARDAA
eukprot:Sspe_Gene.111458::Locus_93542_Transcript_1_1_Confidence_1.000_Length_1091::g.111458::m.111458